MEIYKLPIELAFIAFPFIAFVLTIPFLLHQYRKYGAIPLLKSFIFYSLILYLICAYFLVMLPLPSIDSVKKLTTPTTQLIPFQFIKDILATTSFKIKNLSDVINIFKQPPVYTVLFNIILTLPLGVYLRYYYNKNWLQTIGYTFLLSLFFEITQLSGLYGIYPRPYRLFDIDDLLINTLGGLIGYIVAPLFTIFLPTREELEEKSYNKGTKVTLLRRTVSLSIDFFSLSLVMLMLKVATYGFELNKYSNTIALLIYYIFIPLCFEGKTIGKKIVKLKLVGIEGKINLIQITLRYFIFAFFTIFPYIWIKNLSSIINNDITKRLWSVIIIYQIANIAYYILTLIKGNPIFIYEKITNTKNVSIIERKNQEDKKSSTKLNGKNI